jgi:membrane protease YdiL (CAAX protease family)
MRRFPGDAGNDKRSLLKSGLLFLLLAVAAWCVVRVGVAVFPGDRAGAHLGRVLCSMLAVLALIAGSTTLLRRGRLPADQLALKPTLHRGRGFFLGIAAAILLVGLYAGALHVLVPFHWEIGVRSASTVLLEGNAYFWGNFAEELIFRGYAFIAIARAFGTQRALWILAPAFGLLHVEGLEGAALGKMIATTGAMHFVFAYVYLATRTLWAAVSLHAAANILLHSITGLSGKPAAFEPIFEMPFPPSYDVAFWMFFGVTAAVAIVLAQLSAVRAGAKWLQGSSEGHQ